MKRNSHAWFFIVCSAMTLGGCQKSVPAVTHKAGVAPSAVVIAESPGNTNSAVAMHQAHSGSVARIRLTPVAVDCTAVMVFSIRSPGSDFYMRDECSDIGGITIGVDGEEISLERVGSVPRKNDKRLVYEGSGYRVEILGVPGFWLPMKKDQETA